MIPRRYARPRARSIVTAGDPSRYPLEAPIRVLEGSTTLASLRTSREASMLCPECSTENRAGRNSALSAGAPRPRAARAARPPTGLRPRSGLGFD
jgi:hypothetical protein